MKFQGDASVDFKKEDEYTGEDKLGNIQRWYQKVNFDSLGIPFCARPKGGKRIEFSSYASLHDKSLEIKESSPYKFKHTGDVHRNAHYIGMYVLEQMYVVHKNHVMEEKISKKIEAKMSALRNRESVRGMFREFFEKHVLGLISREKLMEIASEMAGEIDDKNLREWFIEDCETLLDTEDYEKAKRKMQNKIQMRESRAEAKQKGIELVN